MAHQPKKEKKEERLLSPIERRKAAKPNLFGPSTEKCKERRKPKYLFGGPKKVKKEKSLDIYLEPKGCKERRKPKYLFGGPKK